MTGVHPGGRPPRWDLTPIFPGPGSPEFRSACRNLREGVAALRREAAGRWAADAGDELVASFEGVVRRYEELLELAWTLDSYAAASADVDAADVAAATAVAELEAPLAELRHIRLGLGGWMRSVDLEALLARSAVAADRAFALRRLRDDAAHAMVEDAESLAAELHPVAGGAWGRLRARVVASIRAEVEVGGAIELVPLSDLRAMATDPDRTVRRRAWKAEGAALSAHAVPLAAALNGVKGEAEVLARRRGWASPLDEALSAQGLDREILGAVTAATRAALPALRRFPAAKAEALGVDRLAWFDLAAPVGEQRAWSFRQAAELVTGAFAGFSPALGGLAERALAGRWVDAEPRAGKQGGGMCYWPARGVTPVRVEHHGGYDGVRMLAHELGHAYHVGLLRARGRPLLEVEAAPAPLMETAAKVCEEIVRREALARARAEGDAASELALLDASLTGIRRSVVDALTNLLFEERLFTRRAAGELSADEITALLTETRAEVDGDSLDPSYPAAWTWAAQPHLYLDGVSFYNLPYLVGQLLALGLMAGADAAPTGFPDRLDAVLADVGRRSPADLGRTVGIDLTAEDFWADALSLVEREIDRYEALVDAGGDVRPGAPGRR